MGEPVPINPAFYRGLYLATVAWIEDNGINEEDLPLIQELAVCVYGIAAERLRPPTQPETGPQGIRPRLSSSDEYLWGSGGLDQRDRAPLPSWLRWQVWERDDFTCRYCGARRDLSIDHTVPWSRGGTDDPANLVCACLPCNRRKKDRLLDEIVQEQVERQPSRQSTDDQPTWPA